MYRFFCNRIAHITSTRVRHDLNTVACARDRGQMVTRAHLQALARASINGDTGARTGAR